MRTPQEFSTLDYQLARFRKLSGFLGRPKLHGPPLLINSLPKSGTNLIEAFFLELGYKRSLYRCIVRDTLEGARPLPSNGRFYLCHLPDASYFERAGFKSILVTRDIWDCCQSYINYMYMDRKHPVSRFILEAENLEESVSDLLLTPKNPNGVSLVDEYLMFYETDLAIYDLHVDFGDLVNSKSTAMYDIADLLQVDSHDVRSSVLSALSAETPTKNHGRVALFQELDEEFVTVLEARVREILQNRVPDVVRR